MSAEKNSKQIQNSTLNLSFDALFKWHDPQVSVISDQENHAGVQAKKLNCINEFADSGQNTTFDLINLASSKMAVPT